MFKSCWMAMLVLVGCVAQQVEELGTVMVPAPEASLVSGAQSVVVEVTFSKPFQNTNPLVVCTPDFRTFSRPLGRDHHDDIRDKDDGETRVFAASTMDVCSTGFKLVVERVDGGVLPSRDTIILVSWIAWDPITLPPAAGGVGSQGGQVPVPPEPIENFAGDLVIEFPLPFTDPPIIVATARNAMASTAPLLFALTFSKVTETYAVLNVFNLGDAGGWTDLVHIDWRAWSSSSGSSSSILRPNNWEVAWTPMSEPQATVGLSRPFRSTPVILSSILNDMGSERQHAGDSDTDDVNYVAYSDRGKEVKKRSDARQFRQAIRRNVEKQAPPKTWDTYVPTLKNVNSSSFAANVAKVYQTTLWKSGVYLGWVALNASRVCLDDCMGHGVCLDGRCECDLGWTSDSNTCETCQIGYWGPSCEPCVGLNATSSIAVFCSNHGSCDGSGSTRGTGACTCEVGYAGDDCGSCAVGFYPDYLDGPRRCSVCPKNGNMTCSSHGSCELQRQQKNSLDGDNHVCVCDGAWAGIYCAVCERGFVGDACEVACPNLCAGRGDCVLDDMAGVDKDDLTSLRDPAQQQPTCRCDDGWDDDAQCQACAPGFYGGRCDGRCGDCGHGRCDDGQAGSGNCTCEEGYAAESFCQACGIGYFFNPGMGTCQACPGGAKTPCSGHGVPPWQCPNGLCVCAAGYHGEDCSVLGKERGWIVVLLVVWSTGLLVGLLGVGFRAYRRWRNEGDDNCGNDDDDDKGRGRGAHEGLLGNGGSEAKVKRGYGRRRTRSSNGLDPALRKKLLEQCPELKGMEEALSSLGSDAADWLIDFEKLEIGTRIGAGNSSLVYRGLFFDEIVAIKKLQGRCDPMLFGLFFRQEVELLAKLHHPHVVRFYGVCYHAGDFYIITEYCEKTLQSLLQQHHCQGKRLAPTDLYRVAVQVANGMAYLHARHVVHRDLKPENILVDERGNFKICDFGLSKLLSKDNPQMTVQVGTPAFMCPEMAHGTTNMSESVDVYSFGILLWALWSCRDPYYYLNVTPVQLLSRVVAGLRPRIDPGMPGELVILMQACWEQDPTLRPTFDSIVVHLRELAKRCECGGSDSSSSGSSNSVGISYD